MKKLLLCVLSLFVLLSIKDVCYAGDVPETLLGDDSTQVYFGKIKNVDKETITVIQYQNIKGEFTEGNEITYNRYSFTDAPKADEIYLCGYIDENNPLYVWEVTSLGTKDLEIQNSDDMSKRMQKYLNDGKFEEKEKERLSIIDTNNNIFSTPIETESASIIDDSGEIDNVTPARNSFIFTITLIFSGIILLGIVFLLLKKRKR